MFQNDYFTDLSWPSPP